MREHCFARRLDVTVGQKGANAYSVHPQNDIYCCCLSVNNEHQYQLLVFILLRSIYVQRGELCAWYVHCMYVRGIPQGDMYVHGVAQGRGELGGGVFEDGITHGRAARGARGWKLMPSRRNGREALTEKEKSITSLLLPPLENVPCVRTALFMLHVHYSWLLLCCTRYGTAVISSNRSNHLVVSVSSCVYRTEYLNQHTSSLQA